MIRFQRFRILRSVPIARLTTEAPASTETTEDVSSPKEENETEMERKESYRRNPILSKCAFLFPAMPQTEEKRLHLRSLRRSKFSTVSLLHTQRPCVDAFVESSS